MLRFHPLDADPGERRSPVLSSLPAMLPAARCDALPEGPRPVRVLSVTRGRDADVLHVELEISRDLAVMLARAAAALWPLSDKLEDDLRAKIAKAERDAALTERLARLEAAGRVAFHRRRKSADRAGMFADVAEAFGFGAEPLGAVAVEHAARNYGRAFQRRYCERRLRRLWELHAAGLEPKEIARRLLPHTLRSSDVLRILRERRGRQ